MPETVTISYKVVMEGMQKLEEFIKKNNEASQEIDQLKRKLDDANKKVDEANKVHEKHQNILEKSRKAILNLRKELFTISLTIGIVVGAMKTLASVSDEMTATFEKWGLAFKAGINNLGIGKVISDFTEQVTGIKKLKDQGFFDKLTGAQTVAERDLSQKQLEAKRRVEIDILTLSGRMREALEEKIFQERAQMERDIIDLHNKGEANLIRSNFERRAALLREEQRLQEYGLKKQFQIMKDLDRDLLGAFKGGISSPLAKMFSGERQSIGDVAKGFQVGIANAVANAISETIVSRAFGREGFSGIFSSLTQKKNPTTFAVEQGFAKANQYLSSMARCGCDTAANTAGGMRGPQLTSVVMSGGGSGGGKAGIIGSIAGAIGSIAGLFTGGGGGGKFGNFNASPEVTYLQPKKYGGEVAWQPLPRFQSGGEVPIMAHAGEFVVNRASARDNIDLLKDINSGGRKSKRAQNIFLIKANDAASFEQMLSSPSAQNRIEMQIIKSIMSNSEIRRVMRTFAS